MNDIDEPTNNQQTNTTSAHSDFIKWHESEGFSLLAPNEELPSPDWICPERIQGKSITLLSAPAKFGKTMLGYELALAAASGSGALRRPDGSFFFNFPQAVPTYYLDTETSKPHAQRRLRSIAKAMQLDCDALLCHLLFLSATCDCLEAQHPFGNKAAVECFVSHLRSVGIRLLIVDTLSDTYPSGEAPFDENSQRSVQEHLWMFRKIAVAAGVGVFLIHHHSKGGRRPSADSSSIERAAGSSQLLRKPSAIYSLSPNSRANPNHLRLEVVGNNIPKIEPLTICGRALPDGQAIIFEEIASETKQAPRQGGNAHESLVGSKIAKVIKSSSLLKQEDWSKGTWVSECVRITKVTPKSAQNWLKIAEGQFGWVVTTDKNRYKLTSDGAGLNSDQ